jgi:GMP synthase (glutamine-hydrolysing)
LLAQVLGGQVRRAEQSEIGWFEVATDLPDQIPSGPWLVWHYDAIVPPPQATVVARTSSAPHAFLTGVHTGVQFHPEATPEMVRLWVAEGARAGLLDDADRHALLAGLERHSGRSDLQARRLLENHLDRGRSHQTAFAGGGSDERNTPPAQM